MWSMAFSMISISESGINLLPHLFRHIGFLTEQICGTGKIIIQCGRTKYILFSCKIILDADTIESSVFV